MSTRVVLWIGRDQATLVAVTDGVEKITHIESSAGDKATQEQHAPWRDHCRRVADAIQGAREVFIFGTAQAKLALKSELLKHEALSHRIVGTETAGRMTERQLVTRAREICGSDGG